MISKIENRHLQKLAYIYIRQSTMGQVRYNQESTERQYALEFKAQELGWDPSKTKILDRDLGQSGAQITGREDFKTIVADVSMDKVGAVFALEASRLARSCLEWHRLIELCSLTGTLVIDEDGCYDPADFNDGLLLGLKGTIAQAELHFIRARLQGGKLNKAKKGELCFPLPVGLCYDQEGRTVLDPDKEVQGAVRMIFDIFRETGSAYGVVHRFNRKGQSFPKRAYGGAWDGKLIWGHLGSSRVLTILKNPAYAGVYAYGRFRSTKEITPEGEVHTRTKLMPGDSWLVTIKNHHEGYITWEEFLKNKESLERNRTNGEETLLSGPAREGLALLQGLLLCARCGRKITVRYKGNGGVYPTYECNRLRREGLSTTGCLFVRCDLLDSPISKRIPEVIKPSEIEIALKAVHELEQRDEAISRQWQMRLERAEYEAQLAERRYMEVDPSQRLVAATLENRWNNALLKQEEIKKQFADFQQKELRATTPEQKAQVLALAKDFPRLWNSPTTKAKDKKRMLRLLIKDITVEKDIGKKQVVLHVRWQGGACEDFKVEMPPSMPDRIRYPEEVVERVRGLSRELTDAQITTTFNQEGIISAKGKAFTVSMIKWIRYRYNISPPQIKHPEELTVRQVADKFCVSIHTVYYWIERGIIKARRLTKGSPYWITSSPQKEKELYDWVRNSTKIQKRRSNNIPKRD